MDVERFDPRHNLAARRGVLVRGFADVETVEVDGLLFEVGRLRETLRDDPDAARRLRAEAGDAEHVRDYAGARYAFALAAALDEVA